MLPSHRKYKIKMLLHDYHGITIPDFNIDTRKTLDFFVALFGLNLNEHESTIKNAS